MSWYVSEFRWHLPLASPAVTSENESAIRLLSRDAAPPYNISAMFV